MRNAGSDEEAERFARAVIDAGLAGASGDEISFMPARVLFQDFTGVPVFVDFAAMRDEAAKRGADPALVNPGIPCTLIIDHSVIADHAEDVIAAPGTHPELPAGTKVAMAREANERIEADRNRERFAFLKWAGRSFDNVEIVPPGSGICHQLNIERFCRVVGTDALAAGDIETACFDTLVGTDSHTTTANGIGVLGWGVGGIEAEAAALGQPISMLVPQVVELHLTGALPVTASGMDLALTVCKLLRSEGVVGMLVEATGDGVASLTATQRACVANMTPEYGATTTLFPVDGKVLDYLALTGRDADEIAFVEAYCRAQGTFGSPEGRVYAKTVSLDLSTVEPCLAGPSRPHNRVSISGLRERFEEVCAAAGRNLDATFEPEFPEHPVLGNGAIAIAAITSCTTATDPAMMIAAGLVAKKAVERGLVAKPWVKKVLAPGSHAVSVLLERAGLLEALAQLGFEVCGYGCMSCIGNSGPINPLIASRAKDFDFASVLSGNRNFDGRISPDVAQNYLAQPALVVAYSLAGTVRIDLDREPVGFAFCDAAGNGGEPVMLADIMPSADEIEAVLARVLDPSVYEEGMKGLFDGSEAWQEIPSSESGTFAWDESSTYIRRAPYFDIAAEQDAVGVEDARILALLGDFVTTDHISPAGSIAASSPAAAYLGEHGVERKDFNTYGARRGNHEVMARGTFANIRLVNALAGGRTGGFTENLLTGEVVPIFDAAEAYRAAGVPLVVVAGKMYGSGSSRDWAAKGPLLQGVKAVIAESFERIHRSNLVQMGIIPLQFAEGEGALSLGLTGEETVSIDAFPTDAARAPHAVEVRFTAPDGTVKRAQATVRVDTPQEWRYIEKGGILPFVLDMLVPEA